ncbi:hypothetical protein [Nostoc sp. UHCC 0251]|uniref:hypothetical protein n=1 Tax=Nostoc sp. UHCC 0251 TaxID=3110240 RepID=UPI002B210004|nr:hypothetical protein [Nostoc sp. UHCC 0251]MEA5623011.1 hypothetical protein [Nostoc sp. UHCC 0251]
MSNLSVQLPDSLYKSLQELAKQDGISIDQFVATAVAEKIAALTTEIYYSFCHRFYGRPLRFVIKEAKSHNISMQLS